MSETKILLIIAVSAYLIIALIHRISKNKKPFRRAFMSIISGPVTLTIINLIGSLFGIGIPVSILSLAISTIGGIAGVTLILALNLFF